MAARQGEEGQVPPPSSARILSAFDSLPLASDERFRGIVDGGRLRYTGSEGSPDLIDRLSARLACSALREARREAVLLVLPDEQPRRCPVLFATVLVTDALAHLSTEAVGRRVLYVSPDASIRTQLKCVQAGSLALDTVFNLQYGRGVANNLHTMSAGGIRLPAVLCIQAPANSADLIRQHHPKWIAVDCGDGKELTWLPSLLDAAKRLNTPVIGWTTAPFSGPVNQWLSSGGGVFRWPRRRAASLPRVDTLDQLMCDALAADVTPLLLTGDSAMEISRAFASAAEALLAASALRDGRLSADAVAVGWMYLRAMESLPVPLEVHEREAGAYWGVRRIGELHDAFARFTDAIGTPRLRQVLGQALDSLTDARARLGKADPPLWLGLANICMNSEAPRVILFQSKARLQMFSYCLLAEFNVSDDDLRDVGVRLRSLAHWHKEGTSDAVVAQGGVVPDASSVLVGLPSRQSDRYLESFLQATRPEVLLWPHHNSVLQRRLRALSGELTLASRGLQGLLPTLDGIDTNSASSRQPLQLVTSRGVTTRKLGDESAALGAPNGFWKKPDTAQAIATLFGAELSDEDDEDRPQATVIDEAAGGASDAEGEDAWVQDAVEISLDGGQCLLLPADEKVNVIARGPTGATVTQRYSRSLRSGDEILFIQGQRRQSLYELLVSRVHRHPLIAQYLDLVRRWQDDFGRAFADAERTGKSSPERLLADLQAKGSSICTTATIRAWARRQVLAPSDAMDIKRIGDIFSLGFVQQYFHQIHNARGRLWGLHINLSARLNRWLESSEAGSAAVAYADNVIDAELGLTVEDFRHSLLRLRVVAVVVKHGPFYRPTLGRLDGDRS